jgi:hypothetical protein
MKMTLLALVQDILNDINGDAINAITDTEESIQVAQIVKTTYFEMWSRRLWAHSSKLTLLESVSDSTKPNFLKVPQNIGTVKFIKYNRRKPNETRRRMIEMKWLYPDEFLLRTENQDSTQDNITVVKNHEGVPLNIKNDKAPEYYTSFDDEYVVFDSWDKSIESTMLGKESQLFATEIPEWSHTNNFTPKLSAKLFPALLAEAKSVSALKLLEEADDKAEQQSKRQQVKMSLENWTVGKNVRYPNYGRQSAKSPARRRPRVFGDRN